jgi:hypothetical protein
MLRVVPLNQSALACPVAPQRCAAGEYAGCMARAVALDPVKNTRTTDMACAVEMLWLYGQQLIIWSEGIETFNLCSLDRSAFAIKV